VIPAPRSVAHFLLGGQARERKSFSMVLVSRVS